MRAASEPSRLSPNVRQNSMILACEELKVPYDAVLDIHAGSYGHLARSSIENFSLWGQMMVHAWAPPSTEHPHSRTRAGSL